MVFEDTPKDGFERLHWASLLFGIGRHAKGLLLPAVFVLFFAPSGGWEYWVAILFVPSAIYELYRYATLEYRIAGDELVIKRGLVFRSERHIPLSRIQNIDLVQNPVHRWLRVADARIETAGGGSGGEPEAVFRVLSLDAVDRMRRRVFAERRTAGDIAESVADPGAEASALASEPAGESLLRIPAIELVKLGLISNRGMALVALGLGLAWEFDLYKRFNLYSMIQQQASHWNSVASLITLAAFMIGAFALLRLLSIVWIVLHFHNYDLRRQGDDLRLTCGLLTRVTATIPRRRIQLVSVRQTLFQRWMGRASIRVETAGSSGGEEGAGERSVLSRRWFVPTVDIRDLPRLLGEVRPGLEAEFAQAAWTPPAPRAWQRMMKSSLFVALIATTLATAIFAPWGALSALVFIPLALWHAHLEARFLAYASSGTGLLFRSGAWTRQTSATFYDKMQAVEMRESPFDRRYRMATLAIDTAGAGPAEHRVRIPYLPREAVVQLVAHLFERTERTRFQW